MAEVTNYATLREDILRLAEEHNRRRLELAAIQQEMTGAITRLVEFAARLFPRAVEAGEYDDRGQVIGEYHPPGAGKTAQALPLPEGLRAAYVAGGGGKRACSICRKPGHRSTTCPEAHLHREAQKARKPRKPMSEERKAQLREQLKKARAARR